MRCEELVEAMVDEARKKKMYWNGACAAQQASSRRAKSRVAQIGRSLSVAEFTQTGRRKRWPLLVSTGLFVRGTVSASRGRHHCCRPALHAVSKTSDATADCSSAGCKLQLSSVALLLHFVSVLISLAGTLLCKAELQPLFYVHNWCTAQHRQTRADPARVCITQHH